MTDWNDANIEILKAGLAAGDSYAQIAKRIPGCTRCAAIGKALRLGLERPAAASKPAKAPRAPAVERTQKKGGGLAMRLLSGKATEPVPVRLPRAITSAAAFSPLPGSTPRVWTERLSGMCCWAVGGEGADTLSCCEPVHARGWCRDHFHRGTASEAARKHVDARLTEPVKRRFAHG